MPHQPVINRRTAVQRTLGIVAAGAVRVAAPHWKKPVIISVLLPAHAQATSLAPPNLLSTDGPRITSATSELRTPSGGSPSGPTVDSLNSLTITACLNIPGIPISCSAEADLGGTMVSLGTSTSAAAADGSLTVTINVPSTAVAPTAAIVAITVTCVEPAGSTAIFVVTPANLSAALLGTATPATC